jgi:hypothetical protein
LRHQLWLALPLSKQLWRGGKASQFWDVRKIEPVWVSSGHSSLKPVNGSFGAVSGRSGSSIPRKSRAATGQKQSIEPIENKHSAI